MITKDQFEVEMNMTPGDIEYLDRFIDSLTDEEIDEMKEREKYC